MRKVRFFLIYVLCDHVHSSIISTFFFPLFSLSKFEDLYGKNEPRYLRFLALPP